MEKFLAACTGKRGKSWGKNYTKEQSGNPFSSFSDDRTSIGNQWTGKVFLLLISLFHFLVARLLCSCRCKEEKRRGEKFCINDIASSSEVDGGESETLKLQTRSSALCVCAAVIKSNWKTFN